MADKMATAAAGLTEYAETLTSVIQLAEQALTSVAEVQTPPDLAGETQMQAGGDASAVLTGGIDKAADELETYKTCAEQAEEAIEKLGTELADAVKESLFSVETMQKLAAMSDGVAGTRTKLTKVGGEEYDPGEMERMAYHAAQRSRGSYLDMADTMLQVSQNAPGAFQDVAELTTFTETLNKQFLLSEVSSKEAKTAILALTEAMGTGSVKGEALTQLLESSPEVGKALSAYMGGVPTEQVSAMAGEEGISTETMVNAVLASADQVDARVKEMEGTWAQAWSSFQNTAIMACMPVLNAVNWIASNLAIIGPLVWAAGAAFAVFQVATHWTTMLDKATKIYSALQMLLSAGFLYMSGNAAQAAATMSTLNGVLGFNPIALVVMAIVALIGILYAAVGAYNKFTGESVSATGLLLGALLAVGAQILNVVVIPLQNGFAMLANFIGNLFQNPLAAVQMLFLDLADSVLGYLASLAHGIEDLINQIPGVEVHFTGVIDELKNRVGLARQEVKDSTQWVEYVKKWDFFDLSQVADYGYSKGEAFASFDDTEHNFAAMPGMGNIPAYGTPQALTVSPMSAIPQTMAAQGTDTVPQRSLGTGLVVTPMLSMTLGSDVAAQLTPPGQVIAPDLSIPQGQVIAPDLSIPQGQVIAPDLSILQGQMIAPDLSAPQGSILAPNVNTVPGPVMAPNVRTVPGPVIAPNMKTMPGPNTVASGSLGGGLTVLPRLDVTLGAGGLPGGLVPSTSSGPAAVPDLNIAAALADSPDWSKIPRLTAQFHGKNPDGKPEGKANTAWNQRYALSDEVDARRYEARQSVTNVTPSITVNVQGGGDKVLADDIAAAVSKVLTRQMSAHTRLSYAD